MVVFRELSGRRALLTNASARRIPNRRVGSGPLQTGARFLEASAVPTKIKALKCGSEVISLIREGSVVYPRLDDP